jgi:hypothetical protein
MGVGISTTWSAQALIYLIISFLLDYGIIMPIKRKPPKRRSARKMSAKKRASPKRASPKRRSARKMSAKRSVHKQKGGNVSTFPDFLKYRLLYEMTNVDDFINLCRSDPVFFETCKNRKKELFFHVTKTPSFMNSFVKKISKIGSDTKNLLRLLSILPKQYIGGNYALILETIDDIEKAKAPRKMVNGKKVPKPNTQRLQQRIKMLSYYLVLRLNEVPLKFNMELLYNNLQLVENEFTTILHSLKSHEEKKYQTMYLRDHKTFVDGFAKQMETTFRLQNGVSPDLLRLINLMCVKYLVTPFVKTYFNKQVWAEKLREYFYLAKGPAEFAKQRCALTVVELLYKSSLFQYISETEFRAQLLKVVTELNNGAHYNEMKASFDTNMRYIVSMLVNSEIDLGGGSINTYLKQTSHLDELKRKLTVHDVNAGLQENEDEDTIVMQWGNDRTGPELHEFVDNWIWGAPPGV